MTGVEFDRSLRQGAARGELSLPSFGRLLAATENGGPTSVAVTTQDVEGPILGVFVCRGEGPGPVVTVKRGQASVLWFKSDGCNAENIYSGQSPPIGSGGPLTLEVEAPSSTVFSVVLEEVADASS